jgi:hypothetical protein
MHRSRLPVLLLAITAASQSALAQPATKPVIHRDKAPADQPGDKGTVDLRPRWERGQTIRYRMAQTSTSQVPDPQDPKNPTKITNKQEIQFSLRVKDINAETGVATVDMVYDSLKIKLDGSGIVIDFDSTKPQPTKPAPGKPAPNNPATPPASSDPLDALKGLDLDKMINDQLRKMVGTTLTLTIDRSGQITNISGGSELDPTGMLGALGGQGAGPAGAPQTGGSLFGPLPPANGNYSGLVRVGQKWSHADALAVGPLGAIKMITEHTLRSASAGTAEVLFTGRIDPASAASNAQAQIKASSHSGRYTWDTAKGQLVSLNMDQKVVQQAPGQAGDATSTTSMTVERLR